MQYPSLIDTAVAVAVGEGIANRERDSVILSHRAQRLWFIPQNFITAISVPRTRRRNSIRNF